MPKISFLDIVNYLENLAENHTEINSSYRWNVAEMEGNLRSGLLLPVMLIDAIETKSEGSPGKFFHVNTTAVTILGKENTPTASMDDYENQNIVLNFCQGICFEIESRIVHDSKIAKINDLSNWLFGMVDLNSIQHFKIGPITSDSLYGYRLEFTIKNNVPKMPTISKWNDL